MKAAQLCVLALAVFAGELLIARCSHAASGDDTGCGRSGELTSAGTALCTCSARRAPRLLTHPPFPLLLGLRHQALLDHTPLPTLHGSAGTAYAYDSTQPPSNSPGAIGIVGPQSGLGRKLRMCCFAPGTSGSDGDTPPPSDSPGAIGIVGPQSGGDRKLRMVIGASGAAYGSTLPPSDSPGAIGIVGPQSGGGRKLQQQCDQGQQQQPCYPPLQPPSPPPQHQMH